MSQLHGVIRHHSWGVLEVTFFEVRQLDGEERGKGPEVFILLEDKLTVVWTQRKLPPAPNAQRV